MVKKTIFISLWAGICMLQTSYAQRYILLSPDKHLQVDINNEDSLYFSIRKDDQLLIPAVAVNMILGDGVVLGEDNKVRKVRKESVHDLIHPVIPIRNSTIRDDYNEILIQYKARFNLVFRVYNNAVAYRFETDLKDSIIVRDEKCRVTLPKHASAWFSFLENRQTVQDRWMNNYEHSYTKAFIDQVGADKTTQLPLLIDLENRGKVLITESDLHDYPGLYFSGSRNSTLRSVFPPRVKTEQKNTRGQLGWDRIFHPATVYDYIARTSGKRNFPWRIFAFADRDINLLDNEIVYKLGEPSRLKDAGWIKPGLVSWDWWNHWNITGVDFKAGINTDTYKYYIDFASRHHILYIIMDDGWYKLGDLTQVNADINMQELTAYAKQKGVGIILWCSWHTLDVQMEKALDLFQKWGIRGIKVDFMNRDDQSMVNFYWRCAKAAAAHHLIVDFHGSHKPAGILRTYPNVLNFEGLQGLEQDKWSDSTATPAMAVSLPYIRMFAGPMDYTPGAMRNAQKKDFRAINDNPMSLGTRCQQLAMYIIFDAPLQMLADNPTAYEKNNECLDFITGVPTTWDETIPLDGKVGEYILLARRKGAEYFAAAMTNWNKRDITLNFSFLPDGNYHMIIFRDGINADRNGMDYKKVERMISNHDKITIHLAPGGGWAARIYR